MNDDKQRCRCDSIDHGHPKNECEGTPRPAGDGLCQSCSDKIATSMGDIVQPMSRP
jgi:hypothetical protein